MSSHKNISLKKHGHNLQGHVAYRALLLCPIHPMPAMSRRLEGLLRRQRRCHSHRVPSWPRGYGLAGRRDPPGANRRGRGGRTLVVGGPYPNKQDFPIVSRCWKPHRATSTAIEVMLVDLDSDSPQFGANQIH
jgi:hypothetical protein